MNNKLIFTLVFVGFGVACGGDDDGARRSQQGYETVQEGSAAGVTSTIQGPGEALPPLTGTNADTTTAFTIDPNAIASSAPPAQSAPGTLAGTMPPISTQYPPPMTSSPAPSRSTAPPVRTQPAPQREPSAQPPDTDTAVTPTQTAPPTQTAAPTQTAPPTNTAPPPPPREEEEEEEEPPPPTSTDTRGGQR